ncbi:MAG: hypothetical protein Q4B26_16870, partial [Eubacteriales bacterium]|nr:hypothetical protein [Eubacteriales bacterium]
LVFHCRKLLVLLCRLQLEDLKNYLVWLCQENPNVFAYLNKSETDQLIRKWPVEYIENKLNDESTVSWIISLLETPKENGSPEIFCNYLKLGAMALQRKDYLIAGTQDETMDSLMEVACRMISE